MYRNHLSPPIFPYAWASDWGEDRYGLWQAFTYKDVRHAFRWIQPGRFLMGSPSGSVDDMTCEDPCEGEMGRTEYEDRHDVTIPQGFWLAETTVTQALWQTVMDEDPSYFKGKNRPVEQVSWDDAQTFIGKLNQIHPDLTVRLPRETEWEYACRAGTQTPFSFGYGLTLDQVNYRGIWEWKGPKEWGNGAKQETTDVKTYHCNAWGVYEMHGNVWEWCEDLWYDRVIFDQPIISNPDENRRAIRGGAWFSNGEYTRSATRHKFVQNTQSSYLGFRLVLGLELKPDQQGGGAAGRGAPHGKK